MVHLHTCLYGNQLVILVSIATSNLFFQYISDFGQPPADPNSLQLHSILHLHRLILGRLGEENQHYVNVRESTDVPEDSIDAGNQYTDDDPENGYADIE